MLTIHDLLEIGFDFGMDKYAIFDENYRETLNKNILSYFMYREITYINPNQWRFKFLYKLDRIMREKYNGIFELKKIEFNPLYNIELTETFERKLEGSQKTENSSDLTGRQEGGSTDKVTAENEFSNVNKTTNSGEDIHEKGSKIESQDSGEDSTENTGEDKSKTMNYSTQYPNESFEELKDESYLSYADSGVLNETTDKKGTKNTSKYGRKNVTSNSGNDKDKFGGIVDEIGKNTEKIDSTTRNGFENSTKNTQKDNGSSENVEKEVYTKKTEGSSAGLPFSKAMLQYIEYMEGSQIELMICKELEEFFMQVW